MTDTIVHPAIHVTTVEEVITYNYRGETATYRWVCSCGKRGKGTHATQDAALAVSLNHVSPGFVKQTKTSTIVTDITDEKIAEAWGASARIHNKALQVLTKTDIRYDIDGQTIGEVIEYLRTLDSDAMIDIYADSNYDVEFAVVNVVGWVDVTPEKRAEMVKAIQARNQAKREHDEREFRRLKRERPHLFLESS